MIDPILGIVTPDDPDAFDVPGDLGDAVAALAAVTGVARVDQTAVDALSGAARPVGRIVYNQTSSRLEMWSGAEWTPSLVNVPTRNMLDNGQLQVVRNAATDLASPAGTRTFAAARWYVNPSGAACTQTATGAGLQIKGAASVTAVLCGQRIESADATAMGSAGSVTFAFKVSNATGATLTPNILVSTPSAVDNFATVTLRSTSATQPIGSGATETVYATVDIAALTGSANGLQIELQMPSGALSSTGKSVTVLNAQSCYGTLVGAIDYPPERAADVRARCARYWQRLGGVSSFNHFFGWGSVRSSTKVVLFVEFATMRAVPAVTFSGASDFTIGLAAGTVTMLGLTPSDSSRTVRNVAMELTVAGATTGAVTPVTSATTNAAAIYLDAEL